ncbi:hypothetical protein ENSA5_57450 [Enhygromyxa salina]|uniref:Uncharacterized protein n=1 Tax=Enhygromyxa salina TaxID=215803 RepID=A0A2S9XEC6_9BACT|nr:hypothetical protein ENSA5_57450 [Enhygromyxa salina]
MPGHAEVPEVGPRLDRRQRKRQAPRKHELRDSGRGLEDLGVVDVEVEVLGVDPQLLGRPRGLVPGIREAVGELGLEQLVDQVDVRQRRVGVGAIEQDVADVRAARAQGLERVAVLLRGPLAQEREQIRQVRGRAEHRAAVLARAIVEVAEDRREIREAALGPHELLGAGDLEHAEVGVRLAERELGREGDRRAVDPRGLVPDGPGQAFLVVNVGGQQRAELVDELLPGGLDDLRGRDDTLIEQLLRRVVAADPGRHPVDPLDRLEVRAGHGLIGGSGAAPRIGGLIEVHGDRRTGDVEVAVVAQEGCDVGRIRGGARAFLVSGDRVTQMQGRVGVLDDAAERAGVGLALLRPIGPGRVVWRRDRPGDQEVVPVRHAPRREIADGRDVLSGALGLETGEGLDVGPDESGSLNCELEGLRPGSIERARHVGPKLRQGARSGDPQLHEGLLVGEIEASRVEQGPLVERTRPAVEGGFDDELAHRGDLVGDRLGERRFGAVAGQRHDPPGPGVAQGALPRRGFGAQQPGQVGRQAGPHERVAAAGLDRALIGQPVGLNVATQVGWKHVGPPR